MKSDVTRLSREELEAEVLKLRALEEGQGQTRRRDAIFESAVDFAIVATDQSGIVTDWNSAAERIMGWTASEMIGRSL